MYIYYIFNFISEPFTQTAFIVVYGTQTYECPFFQEKRSRFRVFLTVCFGDIFRVLALDFAAGGP